MTTEKRGRGRPPGSKNKPKTEASNGLKGPGRPAGGLGHNGAPVELTDAAEHSLLVKHSALIREVDSKIAGLRKERKELVGAAKAEGIAAGSIAEFNKMLTQDPEDVQKGIERSIKLARWTGNGVQTNLFDYIKSSPAEETRPYIEGFRAGVEGKPAKCDYAGPAAQDFLRGHSDGAKSLAEALAKVGAEEDEADPFEVISLSNHRDKGGAEEAPAAPA